MQRKYRKRASDPISAMINAVLDALDKKVSEFVTKDIDQLGRFTRWLKNKLR